MNAVQQPESVLLLGGTSEIGLAIVRQLPRERLKRVVLAGRPGERLDSAADHLRAALGSVDVQVAGILPIPMLSLGAFTLIIVLLLLAKRKVES